jgi:hypothetical protein
VLDTSQPLPLLKGQYNVFLLFSLAPNVEHLTLSHRLKVEITRTKLIRAKKDEREKKKKEKEKKKKNIVENILFDTTNNAMLVLTSFKNCAGLQVLLLRRKGLV